MLAVKIPFAIVLTAVEVSRVERCLYATGLGLGWALNIASCWVPFDAKSRSNDSMSVDGGSQSKEKYRNNKWLGWTSQQEYNREWNDGTSRVKRKSSRVSKKDRKCEEIVLWRCKSGSWGERGCWRREALSVKAYMHA
jgi:hypothetical protein